MTQPTPKPPALAFSKMQGLGNDYVYMEEFDFPLMNPAPLAVRISDRRFGVGGDGLILMGASEKADFRMRVFNADGSEAEMCGNGIRCVGKYLYEKQFTRAKEFTVETPAGIRELRLTVEQGEVRLVRVDMGVPRLAPKDIPMLVEGESFINHKILVGGSYFHGTAVSMGNPHLVVPMPHLEQLNLPELGPLFERHFLFPQRVNTEFVEVRGKDHIAMRV